MYNVMYVHVPVPVHVVSAVCAVLALTVTGTDEELVPSKDRLRKLGEVEIVCHRELRKGSLTKWRKCQNP